MLLELEGLEPLGEEGWRHAPHPVGEAVLLVGGADSRCAVPSASPDTAYVTATSCASSIEAAWRVGGEACLGVYAEVLEPGLVRVGDEVVQVTT